MPLSFLPRRRSALTKVASGLAVFAIGVPLLVVLMGSDHKDGPNATADHSADIADLYAWHDSTANTFTAVVTFAGLSPTGTAAVYDPNILYAIHIDRAASGAAFDNTPDVNINMRFARNARGEYAVQVENLPGTTAPISGAVATVLDDGAGHKVFAGLRDDPFFFDLDGFKATLAKPASDATLRFNNTHDTFAGTNVTAVVVQVPLSAVTVNGTLPKLALWATSARKPTAIGMLPKSATTTKTAMALK